MKSKVGIVLLGVFVCAGILLGPALALPREAGGPVAEANSADGLVLVIYLIAALVEGGGYLFPAYPYVYQHYPYESDRGYQVFYGEAPWSVGPLPPPGTTHVTFEFRGSYFYHDPGLHQGRAFGKLRLSRWFNLSGQATGIFDPNDEMLIPDFTYSSVEAGFNISESPWHDIDLSFGAAYVECLDEDDPLAPIFDLEGGALMRLSGDIFPVRPLGLHFSLAASVFENGGFFEAETAVGFFLGPLELRLGYRGVWIDIYEFHGPMFEIAIWF